MMGKRKKNNEEEIESDEVEIVCVSKRKGKRKVEKDLPGRNTAAGPSRDVYVERIISIKPSKSSEDETLARVLQEDQDMDKGWEDRDAALARALQEEFNAPYQSLSYQQSASQLQQIGVTDPELLAQLTGSGMYTSENFADVLRNLRIGQFGSII
jgi:hypothetical protein